MFTRLSRIDYSWEDDLTFELTQCQNSHNSSVISDQLKHGALQSVLSSVFILCAAYISLVKTEIGICMLYRLFCANIFYPTWFNQFNQATC